LRFSFATENREGYHAAQFGECRNLKLSFHSREGARMNAIAIANNDVAVVAWSSEQRISGCLGFSIYRTDLSSVVR
jgi:hypothetical protein